MFSKFLLLIAYFNSSKTIVDNSKAVIVYRPPKCRVRPTPTYLDLIRPSPIKVQSKKTKDPKDLKKNHTNLRG